MRLVEGLKRCQKSLVTGIPLHHISPFCLLVYDCFGTEVDTDNHFAVSVGQFRRLGVSSQ